MIELYTCSVIIIMSDQTTVVKIIINLIINKYTMCTIIANDTNYEIPL